VSDVPAVSQPPFEKFLRDAEDYWFHVYRPQSGDTIVDIGAGRGEDCYAFSKAVGPAGRVWAVEPHPDSFQALSALIESEAMANVKPLRVACVEAPRMLQIETLPVWESNFVRDGEPSPTSHPVRGVRFDDLATELGIGEIDFLKMNIEGAERFALPGSIEALRRTRIVCVCAHDFRADRGEGEQFRTLEFVLQTLRDAGFDVMQRDDPRYYVPYHVHGVRRR
jgi:FkbM family methyltransferase